MLFRRVLSLVLLVELLITQAFVCHCAANDDAPCSQAQAGKPHVHASQLPIPTTEKPKRCSCCRHRHADTTPQVAPSARQLAHDPADDDHDDALYFGEVVATRDEGHRSANDVVGLLGLPVNTLYATTLFLFSPPLSLEPPTFFWDGHCPLYLRTHALLI